ncbi:MAG: helix-turn-helix transcriptional regulator [Verrucomicrobia bacterium]|nr:helix-turn-helix transcriptional regulator [Verrucomicrobiota bacterium]
MRAARELADASTEEIAERLGIGRASLSNLELGYDRAPRLTIALQQKLCHALDLDPMVFWENGPGVRNLRGRVTAHFEAIRDPLRIKEALYYVLQDFHRIRPGVIYLSLLTNESASRVVTVTWGDSLTMTPEVPSEKRAADAAELSERRGWDTVRHFNIREAAECEIETPDLGWVCEVSCSAGALWAGIHPTVSFDEDLIPFVHHTGDAISECVSRNSVSREPHDLASRVRALEEAMRKLQDNKNV